MPVASAAASLDPVHAGLPVAGLGVILEAKYPLPHLGLIE
jgi:hypothetical protein